MRGVAIWALGRGDVFFFRFLACHCPRKSLKIQSVSEISAQCIENGRRGALLQGLLSGVRRFVPAYYVC